MNGQVLLGDLENPMTREVMEPSNGCSPATQLLGEAIQIANGGKLPRVFFTLCFSNIYENQEAWNLSNQQSVY